jgi:uncharacterized flavoprotein (TIGR03862 family)
MIPKPTFCEIAIIGGGPAGLMAADAAARTDAQVMVFDAMPSIGRKFLMAGRGGLNLTHSENFDRFITRYGSASSHLLPIIRSFDPAALRAFAADLGQETYTGSSGRVFPKAMKASPMLRAWLNRLDRLGVVIRPRHRWIGGDFATGLIFSTPAGEQVVQAKALVLAMGGASWPKLGSDGHWTAWADQMGIAYSPLRASNCAVTVSWPDHIAARGGMPLKRIALSIAGNRILSEAVITATGLEGTGIYALSSAIRAQLDQHGSARLEIDLCPDLEIAEIIARLGRDRGKKSWSGFLGRVLSLQPQSIALAMAMIYPLRFGDLDSATQAQAIKSVPITITGTAGLERAISTAGGICFSELDEHLMLRAHPGIFIVGEMLDFDAPTGGYLLQQAFATGHCAGLGAAYYCR